VSDDVVLRAFCSCGKAAGRVTRNGTTLVWESTLRERSQLDGERRVTYRPNALTPAADGLDEVLATCSSGHTLVADLGRLARLALAGTRRETLPFLATDGTAL
jgi:hypothetical protein